jgi:hypothetical protein
MPEEFKPGCQRPAIKKPIADIAPGVQPAIKEEKKQMVKVGKAAPEFSAPGFQGGKFMNFTLSEYKGKWVLLCFYPGDFTFI